MNNINVGGRPSKVGKGATKHCVFGNCNSDSRKKSSEYDFLSFPKPCLDVRKKNITANAKHMSVCDRCRKCSRWVIKCKRNDNKFKSLSDIKKDTYICTKHFVKEELLQYYPDPLSEDSVYKLNSHCRKRKSCCIGTSQANTPKQEKQDSSLSEDYVGETTPQPNMLQNSQIPSIQFSATRSEIKNVDNAPECSARTITNQQMKNNETHVVSLKTTAYYPKATQTTFRMKDQQMLQKRIEELEKKVSSLEDNLKEATKQHPLKQFELDISSNDKMCKFYTNLSFLQILHLIEFLDFPCDLNYWGNINKPGSSKNRRKKKLTIKQQIIVTLVRLRTGLLVKDLSFRFKLSESLISKTIITCVQFMYHKFNSIRSLMFPSRDKIKETLPRTFKKLKNIRVIIDCAEFFCQSPRNFEQQGNLYSCYKAHTTFKVLIGCTPNGAVSFVSDLFEGSISDKELVQQTNLLDLLEEGDLVLADRGFTIKDLIDKKNVSLNIPPFLKGRNTLTPEEEMETKKIAKERIYVEHVVGRLKQFRLLQKVLPLNMRSIMSQIVFVCACLLNFQEPLVCD